MTPVSLFWINAEKLLAQKRANPIEKQIMFGFHQQKKPKMTGVTKLVGPSKCACYGKHISTPGNLLRRIQDERTPLNQKGGANSNVPTPGKKKKGNGDKKKNNGQSLSWGVAQGMGVRKVRNRGIRENIRTGERKIQAKKNTGG